MGMTNSNRTWWELAFLIILALAVADAFIGWLKG